MLNNWTVLSLDSTKIAILLASVGAAAVGVVLLLLTTRHREQAT